MDQVRDFADERLIVGCIYCGGAADTRDHVPSRVFLDAPFPENLPVVGACRECNNGFSGDEAYLACLIEATVTGTTDPEKIRRPSVAAILVRSPKLRAKLDAAKNEADGKTWFAAEGDRVRNVVVKLARGHAAFELSQPCREAPAHVAFAPLESMSDEARAEFEDPFFPDLLPEVGSRASQRMMVVQPMVTTPLGQLEFPGFIMQDWQDVQEGRYAYLAAVDGDEIRVRIIIGDYLACEIRWAH